MNSATASSPAPDPPPKRALDPRLVLMVGVVGLMAVGLTVRTLIGPVPRVGRLVNEGLSAGRAGDWTRAYAAQQRVLEARPHDANAWFRAGSALLGLDRPLDAAVYLRKSTEIDPTSSRKLYQLAKAFAAGGLPDKAEEALDKLFERKPRHADGLFLRSAIVARRGAADESFAWLQRALAASPSHPERFYEDESFDPVRNDERFHLLVASARGAVFQEDVPRGARGAPETPGSQSAR